jgi:hypothetical protein
MATVTHVLGHLSDRCADTIASEAAYPLIDYLPGGRCRRRESMTYFTG